MDPSTARSTTWCRRFPRPRGDGTVRRGRLHLDGRGFPAHAGMDREPRPVPEPCHRFPRPRGDGPFIAWCEAKAEEVSPPTRGWTAAGAGEVPRHGGFPAHAGMDLRKQRTPKPPRWFPRPRGDGPRHRRRMGRVRGVSPPTRGWTLYPLIRQSRPAGFPAHAGMDPPRWRIGRAGRGFPRPRGDGPLVPEHGVTCRGVSPPTRGWTLLRHGHQGRPPGFPAHAGMDR